MLFSLLFFSFVLSSCIDDPTQDTCIDYSMDEAGDQLNGLCKAMPWMTACSLQKQCQSSDYSYNIYCQPLSLIQHICTTDNMGKMGGCKDWFLKVCSSNSKVKKCQNIPSLNSLVTTMVSKNGFTDICLDHYMDSCDHCKHPANGLADRDCDYLKEYSELCFQMPEMPQCSNWHTMCSSNENQLSQLLSPLCEFSTNEKPPLMRMYFHSGIVDYILFYEWVPRNGFTYFLSILAVILMGLVYEYLHTLRCVMEMRWSVDSQPIAGDSLEMDNNLENQHLLSAKKKSESNWFYNLFVLTSLKTQPFRPSIEFKRMILQMLETTISYCLMLIAMTFNIGLFLAVIFGFGLGTFLFARYKTFMPRHKCC